MTPPPGPGGPGPGSIRPVSAAALTITGIVGLVGGWLLHPLAEDVRGTAPVVTWAQAAMLAFVAVALGVTAWQTHQALHVRQEHLEPHRAINRLAFGRAAAYVGALVAGGYAGYALSWLGSRAELAGERILWSSVAAIAALVVLGCGVALERACRVREDDDDA